MLRDVEFPGQWFCVTHVLPSECFGSTEHSFELIEGIADDITYDIMRLCWCYKMYIGIYFSSVFTVKMYHNSYFIASREIYLKVCPLVPGNPWDVKYFLFCYEGMGKYHKSGIPGNLRTKDLYIFLKEISV